MKRSISFLLYSISFLLIFSFSKGQTPGKMKWRFNTDGAIHSNPAIGKDETIYFGADDNKLYAVNPDGNKQWEFSIEADIKNAPVIGDDGTIYISSGKTYGETDNKLYAINPDGTKKWQRKTAGNILTEVAISKNGRIYFGCDDSNIYALNSTGSKIWSYSLNGSNMATPVLGEDGTIYFGCSDNKLYALNKEGTKKWSYETEGSLRYSPAIDSDGTIYVGSKDRNLYALHSDGTIKWTFSTDENIITSPVIGEDGTVYFGTSKNFYAVNKDGSKKWTYYLFYEIDQTPVIGSDGTIFASSDTDSLYAFNPNGTIKWAIKTGGTTTTSPNMSNDGILYVGTAFSYLYAIHTDCKGLSNSSWPKFLKTQANLASNTALFAEDQFICELIPATETYHLSLTIKNQTKKEVIIKSIDFNNNLFSSDLSSPLTISYYGQSVNIPVIVKISQSDLYKSKYTISYSYDKEDKEEQFNDEIEAILLIEDSSEVHYTVHKAYDAYTKAKGMNNIAENNNLGVIYRLIKEYGTAERYFENAVSEALNVKYGYSGIKMNQGVVKSDKEKSIEAMDLYESVYNDINSDESTSVIAPQMFYNKAWEEYANGNFSLAYNNVLYTLNHNKTNDFLKAKAYTLLGAIQTKKEEYSIARQNFRNALLINDVDPISKIAQENLIEISRPRLVEKLHNIRPSLNDEVIIQLNLFGEEPYEFELYKNNKRISTSKTNKFLISSFSHGDIGEYFCIIKNWAGEIKTNIISINILEVPQIIVNGPAEFCEGDSVKLTGPDGYDSYLWSSGETSQSIMVNQSGDYTLFVFNGDNIKSPSSKKERIVVNAGPEQPSITPSGNIHMCQGEEIMLSAPDGYSYAWSNKEITQNIVINTSGEYTLQVIDENNCISLPSDKVKVNIVDPEKAAITAENSLLVSSVAENIQWFLGDEKIEGATNYFFQPEKVGYYYVEVTEENGCTSLSEPFFWTENTSIQRNNEIQFGIHIFPNPAKEQIQISIENPKSAQSFSLLLFNSVGQKVWKCNYMITEIHFSEKITLSQMNSGLYYLYIISDEIFHCENIAIQK